MARTRIDPWLTEQPDVVWRQSTLSSIMPDVPYFPPNDSQNKTPKMIKVLLPNAGGQMQQLQNDIWSNSVSKTFYNHPSYKAKSPFQESYLSSPTKKHKSKHLKDRHKSNNDFEAAASKVLAALNMSHKNPENQEPDDFEYEPKPKRVNLLSLPDGDRRKNMVPKVVLRDIGKLISKVCPKLSTKEEESTSACSSPSKMLPTSAGSSPSACKMLPTPASSSLSSSLAPSASKKSPSLSSVSLASRKLLFTSTGSSPLASRKLLFTSENSPSSPKKFQSPTLDEPPLVALHGVGSPNPRSMSASAVSKPSMKTSCERENEDMASSEKSFAPFSKKETTFASLASAALSFSKSPIASPSSFSWPNSSKLLPSNPVESDSSKLSSKFLSLLPDPPVVDDESKPSNNICPRQTRSSFKPPEVREKWKTSLDVPTVPINKSKPSAPIKNGFLGFSLADSKKLRVCFHVNTNILASSLDLLDLHKHSEIPSGSPSTCPHCNVTFSSVRHCKYHQSFTSSDVSVAPTRHNNIQENDLWLCPWCPLMSTSVMLLNSHKSMCREKGRCQQEEKASSVRKNAPISSSRRKSPSSSTSNGAFTSPSKFKVVHGEVIQL